MRRGRQWFSCESAPTAAWTGARRAVTTAAMRRIAPRSGRRTRLLNVLTTRKLFPVGPPLTIGPPARWAPAPGLQHPQFRPELLKSIAASRSYRRKSRSGFDYSPPPPRSDFNYYRVVSDEWARLRSVGGTTIVRVFRRE